MDDDLDKLKSRLVATEEALLNEKKQRAADLAQFQTSLDQLSLQIAADPQAAKVSILTMEQKILRGTLERQQPELIYARSTIEELRKQLDDVSLKLEQQNVQMEKIFQQGMSTPREQTSPRNKTEKKLHLEITKLEKEQALIKSNSKKIEKDLKNNERLHSQTLDDLRHTVVSLSTDNVELVNKSKDYEQIKFQFRECKLMLGISEIEKQILEKKLEACKCDNLPDPDPEVVIELKLLQNQVNRLVLAEEEIDEEKKQTRALAHTFQRKKKLPEDGESANTTPKKKSGIPASFSFRRSSKSQGARSATNFEGASASVTEPARDTKTLEETSQEAD